MTQFTVHQRFKLLPGDGGRSLALGSEDTFPINRMSVELMMGGISRIRSSTKLYSSFAPQEPSSLQLNRAKDSWTSVREEVAHGGSESSDGEYDDEYRDDDDNDLACYRGLVLDLAYRPVNVVCWKRAICLEFMEKADVLEYYDQTVDSPSGSFNIPAVLRVPHFLQVVKRRRIKSNLSRKNILYRDNYTCQYCSSRENLTIDHVLPVARGGEWTWENLVTACARCNSKKGRKTLEQANMKLLQVPKGPKEYGILAIPLTSSAIQMLQMRKDIPKEWREYLVRPSSNP